MGTGTIFGVLCVVAFFIFMVRSSKKKMAEIEFSKPSSKPTATATPNGGGISSMKFDVERYEEQRKKGMFGSQGYFIAKATITFSEKEVALAKQLREQKVKVEGEKAFYGNVGKDYGDPTWDYVALASGDKSFKVFTKEATEPNQYIVESNFTDNQTREAWLELVHQSLSRLKKTMDNVGRANDAPAKQSFEI